MVLDGRARRQGRIAVSLGRLVQPVEVRKSVNWISWREALYGCTAREVAAPDSMMARWKRGLVSWSGVWFMIWWAICEVRY